MTENDTLRYIEILKIINFASFACKIDIISHRKRYASTYTNDCGAE